MIVPKLAGLNCPNCGAAVELRTFGQAITVICPNCHSVLDAKDPNVRVLQQAQSAERVQPLIPLGSRGTFSGIPYEAIGFQVRTTNDPEDGADSWQEYLLYNPYHGYRYLTQYEGHWNFVRVSQSIPEVESETRVRLQATRFQFYSRAEAQTSYVIGEFPWAVRVGDTAMAADYVAAPLMLSSETTDEETTWSLANYMPGSDVWRAFQLPGNPPPVSGSFPNQPSPYASGESLWGLAWKLVVTGLIVAVLLKAFGGSQVYRQSVALGSGPQITPTFEVAGPESNLQIESKNRGDLSFYLQYSLVDQSSGQARSFARSVGAEDRAVVPSVRAGRYSLRMETDQPGAKFDLTVRRSVRSFSYFWIAAVLILLPPALRTWRGMSFERARWQGSST